MSGFYCNHARTYLHDRVGGRLLHLPDTVRNTEPVEGDVGELDDPDGAWVVVADREGVRTDHGDGRGDNYGLVLRHPG